MGKKLSNIVFHVVMLSLVIGGLIYLNGVSPIEEVTETSVAILDMSPTEEELAATENTLREEAAESLPIENALSNGDNAVEENLILQPTDQIEDDEIEKSYYEGAAAIDILSNAVVTTSGGYHEYRGEHELASVFVEEQKDCFGLHTASWYNLWSGNIQNVIFNTTKIKKKNVDQMNLKVGIATGGSGKAVVKIFFDSEDNPRYQEELDAQSPPVMLSIPLEGETIRIEVENLSGDPNDIIFFDILLSEEVAI